MRVDPALEEARRNRKPGLPGHNRLQGEAPEPAIEDIVADLRAQPLAATSPCLGKRPRAGPVLIEEARIGFVIHIHGQSSAVRWIAEYRGDADQLDALDALRLRPGQTACLPPADAASSAQIVQRTFEPIRDIETGRPPRTRHCNRSVSRTRARAAQEHERSAAFDARGLQQRFQDEQQNLCRPPSKDRSAIPRRKASCRAPGCLARRHRPTRPWFGRRSERTTRRPRAAHRRRLQADLQHIHRCFDKTLPLPPQPVLRTYIELNLS